MALIKLSLEINSAIIVLNFFLALFFLIFDRKYPLYRENFKFWSGAILSFVGQGIFNEQTRFLPVAFGLTLISNLALCNIISHVTGIRLIHTKRYVLSMILASVLSLALSPFTPFAIYALPVILTLVSPVIRSMYLAIKDGRASFTPSVSLFFFSSTLLVIHQLDFPFLRLSPAFAAFGFFFASFYCLCFGMIGPMMISEKKQKEYAKHEEMLRRSYERFFPARYLSLLEKESVLDISANECKELTNAAIMFSDLRDFTSQSEKMSSLEIIKFIRGYLNEFSSLEGNSGILDKYIGDGILIVYPNQIENALFVAKKLVHMQNFKTVVGIGLGNVAVGAIGQNNMLNLSIFGNCVNESSRLCNFVKTIDSKILISEAYYKALGQSNGLKNHKFRNIGSIRLRGKNSPSRVYENYDVYSSEKQKQIEDSNAFMQQAIQSYETSNYKDCLICTSQYLI